MASCSLCRAPVIYAKTAASEGRKTMPVNATPDQRGSCWFEKGEDYKGRTTNLLVVASDEHPRPASGRFFRQHLLDCKPYRQKKRIEAALKRAAASGGYEE